MTSPRPQGAGSDLASPASQSPRSLRTSPRPVSELYGSPRADESPALKEGSLGSPWGRSGAHGEEGGRRSFVVSVVPGTPPGLLRDWVFFAFNNHVLLSVFLAHPSHPYNAERRRLVLLNSLGFAFFVASLFFLAGHALPSVPHDWPTTLKLLSLLADQPTTLSVLVQLAWDASGSSLGVCPCAQLCCRRPCGFAMLACFVCQTSILGLLYALVGGVLLVIFGPAHFVLDPDAMRRFAVLFWVTKGLAFLLLLAPAGLLIFLILRFFELRERRRERSAPQYDPKRDLL